MDASARRPPAVQRDGSEHQEPTTKRTTVRAEVGSEKELVLIHATGCLCVPGGSGGGGRGGRVDQDVCGSGGGCVQCWESREKEECRECGKEVRSTPSAP